MTAHASKARANVKTGDKINKNLLELSGKIVSLVSNFIPSAIGCSKPKGPTTFGPFLNCIAPITFLSKYVRYAINNSSGTIIKAILEIIISISIIIRLRFLRIIINLKRT